MTVPLPPQHYDLTEDESKKLNAAENRFYREYSRLVAETLATVPLEVWDCMKERLSTAGNPYSCNYEGFLDVSPCGADGRSTIIRVKPNW